MALAGRQWDAFPGAAAAEPPRDLTVKELANRFLTVQQSNWRAPETTLRGYQGWFARFLRDHPGVRVPEFTVERFAAWKISLPRRGYAAESINHYLTAVRSPFAFAEDTDLISKAPKLRRVRNEPIPPKRPEREALYSQSERGGSRGRRHLVAWTGSGRSRGLRHMATGRWAP